MYDSNLLFYNAATITTSTATPPALLVNKLAADGEEVQIAVTSLAGSTTGLTLDFKIQECDTTNGTWVDNVVFPQITGTGRVTRRVQSKRAYLRMPCTAGAATGLSAVVTAGIVSGPPRDQTA